MRTVIATHELLPKGLRLESLGIETGRVSISVGSDSTRCACPLCGHVSSRAHSLYHRTVSDLPWHGICVTLKVRARRFFCDQPSCERRIFCERLPDVGKVRVLGVDDFAFRRGARYGTILVDLERRRVADLLPERSQESLVAWLGRHPEVETAARDRSNIYHEALAKGAPDATQVAVAKLDGICCTTWPRRWRSSCSRRAPRCARPPRPRRPPRTGATGPSLRDPLCPTGRETTTAR